MQSNYTKIHEFLKKYGMHYENIDIEQNIETFLEEMENGLEGKESSLMMIPTYISTDKEIPLEEPVIVIDAGGTNFRRAIVYFDKNKKPVIEDFKIYAMPGTKGEITKEEFFKTVVKYIEPILTKSNKIGFCFSYPTEIYPNKDGKLVKFNKEVRVKGAEGEMIGENLLKAIKEMGYKEDKQIVLLNDTVATLLGGKAAQPDRIFGSFIGFILGTGTNTCYIEKNKNIKKISNLALQEGSMLINMESGGYGRFQTGKIDKEFDSGTTNPGEHIFEKMVSGAYQGGLILEVIKKAAEEKLFSCEFTKKISEIKDLTSREIDDFLNYPYGENVLAKCSTVTEDPITLYYLIDSMVERAARLVAINLSAVILKTEKGDNPCAPVCISAEGSTFYKSKFFRNKLEFYIRTYLNDQKKAYCEFIKVDDITLIGTAIAGLIN